MESRKIVQGRNRDADTENGLVNTVRKEKVGWM